MPIAIGNLVVGTAVVHDVPRFDPAVEADDAITFSGAPIANIDAGVRNFLRERMTTSLGPKAFAVERHPDQLSDVPGHVRSILDDADELVPGSQAIARSLYNAQNKINNPGLLVVVIGRLNMAAAVGVLKLQRQQGMRMHQIEVDGEATFDAEIFRDLTLTEETRVFKASIFRATGQAGLDGLVSDDQRGSDPREDVADFFLRRFLGCRLKKLADVATRDYFEATVDFIATVPDATRRRDYEYALIAMVNSPQTTIDPTDFAERYIHSDERQRYLDYLAAQGITENSFDKQDRLIRNALGRMIMVTENRIRISGPPDEIKDRVEFQDPTDEHPARIIINDTLPDA